MHKVLVINGPNLNMLGIRELSKYGSTSYDDLKRIIKNHSKNKFELEIYQTNIEGEIVSKLHKILEEHIDALIINPGAYTHTSIAIRDALAALKIPIVEVHITDLTKRDDFRKKSVIAPVCIKQISGLLATIRLKYHFCG